MHAISGTIVVKSGFASMVKGGLIMDVINAEQAKIAEDAGVSAYYNRYNWFNLNSCLF